MVTFILDSFVKMTEFIFIMWINQWFVRLEAPSQMFLQPVVVLPIIVNIFKAETCKVSKHLREVQLSQLIARRKESLTETQGPHLFFFTLIVMKSRFT